MNQYKYFKTLNAKNTKLMLKSQLFQFMIRFIAANII